jgi:hypothetical protein
MIEEKRRQEKEKGKRKPVSLCGGRQNDCSDGLQWTGIMMAVILCPSPAV